MLDNNISNREVYDSSLGFDIAFALTKYDSNQFSTDDPTYGQLKVYANGWGLEGEKGSWETPLKTRKCTKNELRVDGTEKGARFWKVHPSSVSDLDYYYRKFDCIDDPLSIFGDFNSAVAQILIV